MSSSRRLVFGHPLIGDDEIDEVVAALRSGWIGPGPRVERFERMLEDYVGADNVRCVASCSAALTLALRGAGVGPGDEVIVPAMTFVATANAVEATGAETVLVDSEQGSGLIDLEAARAAVTPRTRALIVVHLAGRPVDLDVATALAAAHDLTVVEDAAHALGAAWRGRRVGAHPTLTCFSFSASKNVTAGEGGALATDDPALAERVRRAAQQGLSDAAWRRFSTDASFHPDVDEPGTKASMTDIQAAIGIHQLRRLDAEIDRRARQSARYDALLADLPLELPPPSGPNATSAHHLYSVRVPEGADRDALAAALRDRGIGTGVHYRGVHLHRYYRERYGVRPDDLPVASDISLRTLSLPIGPTIDEADQHRVAAELGSALAAAAHSL